jgi:agmatinase
MGLFKNMIAVEPRIVKFPYEEGTYWRKGAKQGPDAIIEQIGRMRGYSLRSKKKCAYKIEDLLVASTYIPVYSKIKALDVIESTIRSIVDLGAAPISLGGDHSITLPIIRALSAAYGKQRFGLIHFDAHSDTFDEVDGFEYHHGAFVRHVVNEGHVAAKDIIQLGIRGLVRGDGLEFSDSSGIRYHSVDDIAAKNFELKDFILSRDIPYYVSIDIDAIDPAYAPGTGTPVPGGFSSRDMMKMLSQLYDLNIIGLDIVEVAPIYDSANITSLLAASILYESLIGFNFKGLQKG